MTLNISEVEKKISQEKQKFINAITEIGNLCDVPIEIMVAPKEHGFNCFFRDGEIHPFIIKVKEATCNKSFPFVMGGKIPSLNEQSELTF